MSAVKRCAELPQRKSVDERKKPNYNPTEHMLSCFHIGRVCSIEPASATSAHGKEHAFSLESISRKEKKATWA